MPTPRKPEQSHQLSSPNIVLSPAAAHIPPPEKVAGILLGAVTCTTIFADYWEYSRQYHANPDWWMDVIRGTGSAPAQYRIAVPWLANTIRLHAHIGLRHALTAIDLVCAASALYLLFSIFRRSYIYRGASETAQWFGCASFLVLVQFYFAWITWYQRPETFASVAMIAATLWLLVVPLPGSKAVSAGATSFLMLLLPFTCVCAMERYATLIDRRENS